MGQTKKLNREFINHVAGHYLTEQDEGDYCDAYLRLLDVEDKDDNAMHYVEVWDQMEYVLVKDLIDLIEGGVDQLELLIKSLDKPAEESFFNEIDWSELRNQKRTLLELIDSLESKTHERAEHLTGILHLIDAVQDFAVDKLEIINSIHVYDFDDEEDRPEY